MLQYPCTRTTFTLNYHLGEVFKVNDPCKRHYHDAAIDVHGNRLVEGFPPNYTICQNSGYFKLVNHLVFTQRDCFN